MRLGTDRMMYFVCALGFLCARNDVSRAQTKSEHTKSKIQFQPECVCYVRFPSALASNHQINHLTDCTWYFHLKVVVHLSATAREWFSPASLSITPVPVPVPVPGTGTSDRYVESRDTVQSG